MEIEEAGAATGHGRAVATRRERLDGDGLRVGREGGAGEVAVKASDDGKGVCVSALTERCGGRVEALHLLRQRRGRGRP
jgi:hypothetical protein